MSWSPKEHPGSVTVCQSPWPVGGQEGSELSPELGIPLPRAGKADFKVSVCIVVALSFPV